MDPVLIYNKYATAMAGTAVPVMVAGHECMYLYNIDRSGGATLMKTDIGCEDPPVPVTNPLITRMMQFTDVEQIPGREAFRGRLPFLPDRNVVARFGHGSPMITAAINLHVPAIGRTVQVRNVHIFHMYIQMHEGISFYGLVSPDQIYEACKSTCCEEELLRLERGTTRVPMVVERISKSMLSL